jgi:hypothetical protein
MKEPADSGGLSTTMKPSTPALSAETGLQVTCVLGVYNQSLFSIVEKWICITHKNNLVMLDHGPQLLVQALSVLCFLLQQPTQCTWPLSFRSQEQLLS